MSLLRIVGLASMVVLLPLFCWAGDGATIVFESGQVVYLNNGYGQVIKEMRTLNDRSQDHRIAELNIEGGSFLLNVAEVVIVCRDRCDSLQVVDVRDPARAPRR